MGKGWNVQSKIMSYVIIIYNLIYRLLFLLHFWKLFELLYVHPVSWHRNIDLWTKGLKGCT